MRRSSGKTAVPAHLLPDTVEEKSRSERRQLGVHGGLECLTHFRLSGFRHAEVEIIQKLLIFHRPNFGQSRHYHRFVRRLSISVISVGYLLQQHLNICFRRLLCRSNGRKQEKRGEAKDHAFEIHGVHLIGGIGVSVLRQYSMWSIDCQDRICANGGSFNSRPDQTIDPFKVILVIFPIARSLTCGYP